MIEQASGHRKHFAAEKLVLAVALLIEEQAIFAETGSQGSLHRGSGQSAAMDAPAILLLHVFTAQAENSVASTVSMEVSTDHEGK